VKKNIREELDRRLTIALKEPFNVILEGESGVGKEHFAKLIHKKRLNAKSFRVFDWECAYFRQLEILNSLEKNHLEEIFDLSNHQGNTFFFRRIDLLDSLLQKKLFEIFEEGVKRGAISRNQIHRLGLISSWEERDNKDQQDAYFENPLKELFPLRISIPPLRGRKKELPSLLYTILDSVNREQKRKVFGFSKESVEVFLRYNWPNNLDELESEIQRAVALTEDYEIIKPQILSERLFETHFSYQTTLA